MCVDHTRPSLLYIPRLKINTPGAVNNLIQHSKPTPAWIPHALLYIPRLKSNTEAQAQSTRLSDSLQTTSTPQRIKDVVCLGILDAYWFLIDSYPLYQLSKI